MRPGCLLLAFSIPLLLLQTAEARVTSGGRTSARDDDDDDVPPPSPYPPGLAPSPPPPVDETPGIIAVSVICGVLLVCMFGCWCALSGTGERASSALGRIPNPFRGPTKASADMPLLAMDTPVRL
jgi:hypothetical protein